MKALSLLVVLSVLLSVVLVALVALPAATVVAPLGAAVRLVEAPALSSGAASFGPASPAVLLARAGVDTLSGEESAPPGGRTG
jgi:hypothetical protein